jgi:multiple sugar transport system substrate-binding protein
MLRGLGAAATALTIGSTTACGDDGGELTFFFQAGPDEATVRMRVIEEFAKRHPDIRIRTQMSGPDPQQQILTYCASGKCPDVLMSWELLYSGLAERGVLLDLNTMLAAEPDYAARLKADSFANLYNTFGYRGGQWALPEQWSGIYLYYNKSLFREAGLTPPPARWTDGWTFAEFLDAARALTKRDGSGKVTQWGFVDAWVPYYSASVFGMNNGVEWFSPPINPVRTNIDDDRFIEGFQFYADLSLRHRVAPKTADQQSIAAFDLFAEGKAGMALVGHWMYSHFTAAEDLDFDVTVLPVGPHWRTARSDIGTTGLSIAAHSPHKRQAWEFVKFATGPEGQAVIASSGLFVPVLASALHSPGFAQAHRRIRNLEVLTEGPKNSAQTVVTPAWRRVDSVLHRASDHVLRGAATADWFKTGTAHEIDALLDKQEAE